MHKCVAVVLAAGMGTRMKSKLPKVLHKIGGKYLVQHVIDAVQGAGVSEVVLVVGYGADTVEAALGSTYRYVVQAEQLGTGHAVLQAEPVIPAEEELVLVLCGDMPFVTQNTLEKLINTHQQRAAAATVLTAVLPDPAGYGRIIRDQKNNFQQIIEEKDACLTEREVQEINTGTYCFQRADLFAALKQLQPNNSQGEYYLTDVLAILLAQGKHIEILPEATPEEALGINSRQQLAQAESLLQGYTRERLMQEGVTFIDPASTYVGPEVTIGPDTVVYPQTIIEGKTQIGTECEIGPMSRIQDSILGNQAQVVNSVITQSWVGDNCTIGPFAYLRPGTRLEGHVKVGDFVELKNSRIGHGSKIPHLSYIGDAEVGPEVNIGCGTITCNYDGVNKHLTTIETGAFIGSNTNLVAPVRIGALAVIGAGSTITKDVPANSLAVERSRQRTVPDWKKRSK